MPLSKRWQYPYDLSLLSVSHRAVARVLVVAGPDVGAALSITTLYSFIESYLFSRYPGLSIDSFTPFAPLSHRQAILFHSGLGSDLRPALGRLKQLAVDAILYRGKDALREEVAPSIGFVLDTRFLGSRFSPWLDT